MNRHQVLTGSANAGDRCFAVGSVEGTHFTAYGAGTTVVILASDFQRVQIIPSPLNGSDLEVSGISCCSDLGKIAASYGSKVCIFEPTPLASHHASSHRLDYQWFHTGSIDIESDVLALKWNLDGSRLLTSGAVLEMWQNLEPGHGRDERRPSFFIEDEDQFPTDSPAEWTCVWKSQVANPVAVIMFSSDGLLFATVGENDRMVKVWYEDRKAGLPLLRSENSSSSDSRLNFNFVYLAHPRAVTGFSWRRTSKYLQKGSIANVLLTSCRDNICRMWCETVLPEDGLLDTQQLEPKDTTSTIIAGQSKKRIVQRLFRIRHAFHRRKKFSTSQVQGSNSLIGALSVPDAQKFGGHSNEIVPSFHFHLAASINLLTDVPLIGSLGNAKNETFDFVLHWLDNKEFQATLEAEKLIDELSHRSQLAEHESVDSAMGNSIGSPARFGNGRKSGLPTIGSDPAINESFKKQSTTTMQKTKSYITMFTGNNRPTSSTTELPQDNETFRVDNSSEQLEHKVEQLMLSWTQGSDMLYGIHPLDGSLLMWVVDNLDESSPGTFGQVKASLSAMMPNTFPLFDALTMQPNVWLYCDYGRLGLKSLKLESELKFDPIYQVPSKPQPAANATGTNSSGRSDNSLIPNVLMVTKHTNGSINMWQISFAESSQFSTIVNVSHISRASGHRFHTDSSACHPVLPLLLTTSHHENSNSSGSDQSFVSAISGDTSRSSQSSSVEVCASELILWHVAPIGPLSKSGGIMELARINSPAALAFRKVAWFPTLLPVSTLGNVSNSPSALFVASDGASLRIYHAVLDGRLILAEQQTKQTKPTLLRSNSNGSVVGEEFGSSRLSPGGTAVTDLWNVVSLQSTSRPGCIIDLKPIADAVQNWQNVQLIHVFQELLISGCKTSGERRPDSSCPLPKLNDFEERFYLVVVEQMPEGNSALTMWLITIASQDDRCTYDAVNGPDASLMFSINVDKVYCQFLPLPKGVSVTTAAVAAGHLSSSSIYPACFAPYLLSTACTDGRVRFWQCGLSSADRNGDRTEYQWQEWRMMTTENQGTSVVEVEGKVLSMSSAYSGRLAIAHRLSHKFDTGHGPPPASTSSHFRGSRAESQAKAPADRLVSLFVSVFECESTGGAKWTLEDTIEIPNVVIADPKVDIDLSLILESDQQKDHMTARPSYVQPTAISTPAFHRTSSVPSSTTVQSIRRILSRTEMSRARPCLKHRTHLDWVSTEDGSHILTVSVGSKIILYTAVSVEPHVDQKPRNGLRVPGKSVSPETSYTTMVTASEVRWVVLRSVELHTADGLPPLPKHLTWVRNGILVVGMENEVHVYSQWKLPIDEEKDSVVAVESDRLAARPSTARVRTLSKTMSGIKLNASIANLSLLATKRARRSECSSVTRTAGGKVESAYLLGAVDECGLFEAARLASPCLPQYHPRQLLELLAFGKTRCVRLILCHLLRCLAGRSSQTQQTDAAAREEGDVAGSEPPGDTAGRSPLSATTSMSEESEVNFLEVTSIPPLPLYVLLSTENTDSSCSGSVRDFAVKSVDYEGLFNAGPSSEAASEGGGSIVEYTQSIPLDNRFGRAQARLLARYLEHVQLPEMSSLEQTNLLALADAMAKTTVEDEGSDQPMKQGLGKRGLAEIIDDCGLRFLVAAQQHSSLVSALPDHQGAALQHQGLPSSFYIWAFHSKSKQELMESLPWKQKEDVTWSELRQFGVGWWLTDIEMLTLSIEKVAKTAFQVSKDPMDVALYYVAMRKKNVLCHLFKLKDESTKVQFFKNDFSEDRWRKAALKNAFHLLARQRFQHAAAFFLLAGAVTDALQVCLTHMRDFQLALVIIRLYEGGTLDGVSASCRRLLYTEILGSDETGRNHNPSEASHDPFIRSMAYWLLDDHKAALDTLLVREDRAKDRAKDSASHEQVPIWKDFVGAQASIFNVYRFLCYHTQVVEKKFPRAKGFSGSEPVKSRVPLDGITPAERQLYFQTANMYFRAGCPLLALEVLTSLPPLIDEGGTTSEPAGTAAGTPGGGSAVDVFGGTEKLAATTGQSSVDFDWSQPVTRFDEDELDLSLGTSSSSEDEEEEDKEKAETVMVDSNQGTSEVRSQGASITDVMAQQLNFIACVKILVNELSTLATGFEVDGGQLRFQLYVWLEKEMEVVRRLCYTGEEGDEDNSDRATDVDEEDDLVSQKSSSGPDVASRALHETILAEKLDLDAKLNRMARRRKWLKAHEQVLSTLLGYSVLHATSASGLASMQMELLLLLQELQQTKMPQHLRWPIPFPTTLPLLAASLASAKTVISDPIRHLQGICQDLLHTLIEFKTTPATDVATSKVYLLRDLSIALSSCVYQCLCDSDSFVVSAADDIDIGLEGFTSSQVTYRNTYLMAGARKRTAPTDPTAVQAPTSLPAQWPGVSSLVTLMNQRCDEDGPQLQVLLMESLVAVFMSLVCYALSVYDAIVLYRLMAHPLDDSVWPLLFGGGLKKPIRVAVSNDLKNPNARSDHNANIRSRLHRHVFGPLGPNSFMSDDRSMYQEQFIPPQINMISYFMAKVKKSDNPGVDYDSADSVNSDDDDDDEDYDDDGVVGNPDVDELKDDYNEDIVFPTPKTSEDRLREHIDPNSYSWCLMRYAVIKFIGQSLRSFLPKIGMDLAELPTRSPLVHSVKKNLEVWEGQLKAQMEAFSGPPKGYIPGCSMDASLGVNIVKYSALANPDHTPFLSTHYSALPAKRLWNYLVTRDCLQDIFIRYVFGKGRCLTELNSSEPFFQSVSETMKIIYKDQETIASFSMLPSNSDCIVLATQKELVELNIGEILFPPTSNRNSDRWENFEVIRNISPEAPDSMDDTCVIQPSKGVRSYALEIPARRNFTLSSSSPPVNNGLTPSVLVGHGGQVVLKRPLSGVKKIAAHPQLPYYLTGLQDGSLRLWELGRSEVVGEPRRASGSLPKLTRVLFNLQGNKFGVSDVDGGVCLWQLGHNLNPGLPFLEMKCHNKGTNDFVFVGSSSLFATAGQSSDNFNVCLWDTLLPKNKALVKGFHCYSDGCSALVYAPCHQAIISGGKKGELYIYDVRQRQLRHTFQAHQSAIKCISFDPTEDSFATGSADGEVKVWGLTVHNLLYTFSSDRSKSSRFRSSGAAISELHLGPNGRLFCSSTDGTLKLRQLTYKHSVVNTWQNDSQTDVTHF